MQLYCWEPGGAAGGERAAVRGAEAQGGGTGERDGGGGAGHRQPHLHRLGGSLAAHHLAQVEQQVNIVGKQFYDFNTSF